MSEAGETTVEYEIQYQSEAEKLWLRSGIAQQYQTEHEARRELHRVQRQQSGPYHLVRITTTETREVIE